jgi:hypothetical protein
MPYKYRRRSFRKVDYKEYRKYLSTLDLEEIKAQIDYYNAKGESFVTAIFSGMLLSAIIAVYTLIFNAIKNVLKNPGLNENDADIIINGMILLGVAIGLILLTIGMISYRNYVNKKYEINLAITFVAEKEKQNGKSE